MMIDAQTGVYTSLFLIIKHTMTESFKIGIGDLILKFLAHTPIFFGAGKTAGAISACTDKPFLYHFDNLSIWI